MERSGMEVVSDEERESPRLHGVFEQPELGIVVFLLVLVPAYLTGGGFVALYGALFAGLLVLTVQNSVADREVFRRQLEAHGHDPSYQNRSMILRGQWGWLWGLSGFGPVIYAAVYFTVYYLLPDLWSAWEAAMAEVVDWCAAKVPNAQSFARTMAARGYPERAPIIEHLVGGGFFIGLLFGTCGVARALVLVTRVHYSRKDMGMAPWILLGGVVLGGVGVWTAFYGLKLDWSPGVYRFTLHDSWFRIYPIIGANILIYLGLISVILSLSALLRSWGGAMHGGASRL